MGFLGTLGRTYLRWRHSKGYGVHSPFAFFMVESVISPGKYGYYGYHDIDRYFRSERSQSQTLSLKQARFLFRLAVNIPVSSILSYESERGILGVVAKASCKRLYSLNRLENRVDDSFPFPKDCLAVLTGTNSPETSLVESMLDYGCSVVAFGPDLPLRRILEKKRDRGVVFSDKNAVVTIPRDKMAFVKYECTLGC